MPLGQLLHAPVQEAICQISFVPGRPWDLTFPGTIYQKVHDRLPNLLNSAVIGGTITAGPQGANFQPRQVARFGSSDERVIAQIGENLVSVNQVKDYTIWSDYVSYVGATLHAYREVTAPSAVAQAMVRFINTIEIPLGEDGKVEMSDFFNVFPNIESNLPLSVMSSFILNVELSEIDDSDSVLIEMATLAPLREQFAAIALNIHCISKNPTGLDLDHLETWLEKAHDLIDATFERSLKDEFLESLRA